MQRYCKHCDSEFDISHFYKSSTYKDNIYYVCKDKYKQKAKEYLQNNREKVNVYRREYIKRKRKQCPKFKIELNLRRRLSRALNGQVKSISAVFGLGCTVEELKVHLAANFYGEMSWENYGSIWHIDHIRPLCSFDLSDPEQQKLVVHYTNLQPLLARDNILKGGRY